MPTSKAKAILLAIELASDGNFQDLKLWVEANSLSLDLELVLRILLSCVPESTEPSTYTPLLEWLVNTPRDQIDRSDHQVMPDDDHSSILDLAEDEARRRVKRLQLLPLSEGSKVQDLPTDPLSLFLIHRAHQIDSRTGLLTSLPQLIVPFLGRCPELRTWFVSTLLPLLRLRYEYHPEVDFDLSLVEFESLEGRRAVNILLSRVGDGRDRGEHGVGRDLRGLVAPWMYGADDRKRRRLNVPSMSHPYQGIARIESVQGLDNEESTQVRAWHDVFEWILSSSMVSFQVVVEVIEQWDGPSDADLGGYVEFSGKPDDDAQTLDVRYAQAALAAIYLTQETSTDVLLGAHRILQRVAKLSKLGKPPGLESLEASVGLLDLPSCPMASANETHLLSHALLRPHNPFTTPASTTVFFLHSILLSVIVLGRLGLEMTIHRATVLCLYASEEEQCMEMQKLVHHISNGVRKDGGKWLRIREELRWLRVWGGCSSPTNTNPKNATDRTGGIFSQVPEHFLERELLKALLQESQYQLVINLYLRNGDPSALSREDVEKTIMDCAMSFYDNASNCSKSRGGVTKASDTIVAFYPSQYPDSRSFQRATRLLDATEGLSYYSLTLIHSVPFQPVNVRVHPDPLALLGKVLEQNLHSYSKLDDLIRIGRALVDSGVPPSQKDIAAVDDSPTGQMNFALRAERRIIGMAIEAALAEDDFETAYSYVLNRLSSTTSKKASTPADPTEIPDDIAWRAAYQAGRHRSSRPLRQSISTAAQSEVRAHEMRMELLSKALLLAPPAALPEILGVWRRCEEEMHVLVAHETQAEARWDDQGERSQQIPGQFVNPSPAARRREVNRISAQEEAPMGLFEVARGAAAAISKSAFPLHVAPTADRRPAELSSRQTRPLSMMSADGSEAGSEEGRVRRRDVVSNLVAGGLASGIGWVLGATPATATNRE